uniref:Uncharacterized protein n=1 Tax=Globisporangium ultimum (strain ATCC 200006 / CBS 805.95 / DAOM BR144) TaxID=431595 RepID=K3WIV0_GLOUD
MAVTLATTASAQRDTSCDDTEPLRFSCNTELASPQATFHCEPHKILALQEGCYYCVNAVTCKQDDHDDQAHFVTETAQERVAMPQPTIQSEVVPLNLPFVPDALSMAESAQLNAANMQQMTTAAGSTQTSLTSSSQEVSNWYFLVPAALALVSLGLAVRSRIDQRTARFDRLDNDDDDEEEINPFCGNGDGELSPQEGKDEECVDLEFAGGYDSTSDDDDAIFGPATSVEIIEDFVPASMMPANNVVNGLHVA